MNLDRLLKKVETFEKLASIDFNSICKNYSTAIQMEVAGGIRAINKLINTNKQNSTLSSLNDSFRELGNLVGQLKSTSASITIPKIKSILGNMNFFTSKVNTGTGFEPITRIGGPWSPGAYVDRINTHVNNLDRWSKEFESKENIKENTGQGKLNV